MRIGILETGTIMEPLLTQYGSYGPLYRAVLDRDPSFEFVTVSVINGEMPTAPTDADAWLIGGSRYGVYDDQPWIEPLKAFLRDSMAAGVPMIGICFGHQILAEALGGRAEKSDKGWGIGALDYNIVQRPAWMADAPAQFAAYGAHQDQVTAQPPGTTLLATSAFCPFAAFAYGDPDSPDAISLQWHPEFSDGFMAGLIALRRETSFSPEVADTAVASLAKPVANDDWGRWLVNFLNQAKARRAAA